MTALLFRLLRRLVREGELTVVAPDGTRTRFGAPSTHVAPATMRIHDTAAVRAVALNPALGAGEMFMAGRLTVEDGADIRDLLALIAHNARFDRDNPLRAAIWSHARWQAWLRERNPVHRSRANVAHHYDLSGDLYALFLDAGRQYSCAYFSEPTMSLEAAQHAKLARIAAKLDLRPGQRVLDIGCGWGGLASFLHRVAGVDVLGVTLSTEQLAYARARAAEQGIADHVRYELVDYRNVTGQFDRIVSVGMFEHVGRPSYRGFFEQVGALLASDGVALLHTIGRAGGRGSTDPWTARYIFPGGYTPALSEIMPWVERAGLWATDLEVWRLHYARTLEHWYARTTAARDAIVRLYDERFYRMWCFYLASSWTAFQYSDHAVFHLQLARNRDAVPLTRGYIAEAEARYLAAGIGV